MHLKLNLSGHFNKSLAEQGFEFPGIIMIDAEKPYAENLASVTSFLIKLGVESNTIVECALPGMTTLCSMVMVSIHGLTGQFPLITVTTRNAEGAFEYVETVDATSLRNEISRKMRPGLINL